MAGFFKHGNEPYDSIKGGEFLSFVLKLQALIEPRVL